MTKGLMNNLQKVSGLLSMHRILHIFHNEKCFSQPESEMSWCEESVRSYPGNCCSYKVSEPPTTLQITQNPVNVTMITHDIHTHIEWVLITNKPGSWFSGERALLVHCGVIIIISLVRHGNTNYDPDTVKKNKKTKMAQQLQGILITYKHN